MVGTWDGLSRYDGYRFTNYGQRDGLEQPFINSVVEDRQGRIWVSTWGSGVARLRDGSQENSARSDKNTASTQKKFVTYRVGETRVGNEVSAMLLDRDNVLWCVTGEGVHRARAGAEGAPKFELVLHEKVDAALADSRGHLWFMGRTGLNG